MARNSETQIKRKLFARSVCLKSNFMELEKGSKILIEDLKSLLAEVEVGEFGDFTNNKYATPKVELAKQLEQMRQWVIDGKYD